MGKKIYLGLPVLVSADIVLIAISYLAALLLRFDSQIPAEYLLIFNRVIPYYVFILIVTFYLFGFYKKLWQYASVTEIINITAAVTSGSLLVLVLSYWLHIPLPFSVYLISWLLQLTFIGGTRFIIRYMGMKNKKNGVGFSKKVLIIGAGEAGVMVAKELSKNQDKVFYEIVGFVDDDIRKKGNYIDKIPVLGTREDLPHLVKERGIEKIIIAIPSASKRNIQSIVDICKKLSLELKILPGYYELIDGKVSIKSLRNVDIVDLLGRNPVQVNLVNYADYIKGEVLLVTGAGGSIGSELCRQILTCQPKKLLILGQGENSICRLNCQLGENDSNIIPIIATVKDRDALNKIFMKYKPGIVFHAAAHKHVPLMENNRREAIINNVVGTWNTAEMAHIHKTKRFVLVSTDKAVNPTSVMGVTKRFGEIVMQLISQKSHTRFCAVRFGNVLGSRGSVVNLFKKQIAEGGPVTVTHPEMVRYFMTVQEAVQLIIQAGAMGKRGEVFVLDMGDQVKIIDLARDLISLYGYQPGEDIDIVFTGIRSGEKLYEEMLTGQEGISSTKLNKIFSAELEDLEATIENELKHAQRILNSEYILLEELISQALQQYRLNKDTLETEGCPPKVEGVSTSDNKMS